MVIALTAATVLMLLDLHTSYLQPLRYTLAGLTYSLKKFADLSSNSENWLSDQQQTPEACHDHLVTLRSTRLVQRGHLQRMDAVMAENRKLRTLLTATSRLRQEVVVATLLKVDLGSNRHRVSINKGRLMDVHLGQTVLDADGLLGQVSQVGPFSSEVVLLTDARHAVPVLVHRTGLRAVAVGIGVRGRLELSYLAMEADILPGDQLVTSGLGGRFPAGYPVGAVEKKGLREGIPVFQVVPSAGLDRGRLVLLVRPKTDQKNTTFEVLP